MCTFFRYKIGNKHIAGKNYDVPAPCYGLILWNPRGKRKEAMIKPPEKPVKWMSKYGSITFNQVGRDFPASGMNEKGLLVEQTTLWNTIYPDKDNRDAIKELQLIQYLLDTCSTTREAVDLIERVRISQDTAKLQYVISDGSGEICLIEFILGEMKIYYNDKFHNKVITNDMIDTSVDYLNTHLGFGGTKSVKYSKFSLDRYVVIVDELKKVIDAKIHFDDIEILDKSKYEDTQWQIIYDFENMSIKWRTQSENHIKQILLNDYIHEKNCLTIDINNKETKEYTYLINLELITHFFKDSKYFKSLRVRDSDIEFMASYPEK